MLETILGTLVIVVCVVFLVFAYHYSNIFHKSTYALQASFDEISGLQVGADVKIAGIKIGTVSEETLSKESFTPLVTMQIQSDIQLPCDSSAKITSSGLFGTPYIAISPGGESSFLQEGDSFGYTQGAVDIWGLINQFMFGLDKGNAKHDKG